MHDNISTALITAFEQHYDTRWDDAQLRNERLAWRAAWDAAGAAPVTPQGEWRIDTSAGREILVYKGCSVIEEADARYVLSLIAAASQPAAVAGPAARKVFLVATGETSDGAETYTRHDDAPPPLCDAECLYTAPAAPALEAPAAPGEWPCVSGVGRDAESPRTLLLHLQTEASDDELRAIHDALLDGGALATHALSELMHIGYRFEGSKLVPPEKLSDRASEFFGVAAAPQAPAAPSEPVYQISQPYHTDPKNTWRDASEAAYDVSVPARRRVLFTGPAAPASPSALATQVIENLLQLARIVNTAVEDWGESFPDGSCEVKFHKDEADKMEAILEFFDGLPDAPEEEGVILSGPSRAARVLRAQAAPAAPVDPMDWPLPCDVTVGHGTIRKGCKLRTLVLRMQVLYNLAKETELAAPAAPVPWLPYLSDRADGVKGRYAIARHNPAGYREVWNMRRHCWSAFSDEVLTMDEALAILQKLTMPTAAPAAPAVDAPIVWPKARDVGRIGDMSPSAHLRIGLDSDNDVWASIWDERGGATIEFCTPGAGGGKSSRTRMALLAVMVAMEADNAADPRRDWWAERNGEAQAQQKGL